MAAQATALALASALALLLASPGAALAAHSSAPRTPVLLEHLSLSGDARETTLTLELSGPVRERALRLHSPERLVIDLPDARRQARLPDVPADSLVRAVRSGRQDERTLRLVLDLRAHPSVHLRWRTRATGSQLRIELVSAAESTAPAAATSTAAPALPEAVQIVRAAHAPQAGREVIIAVDPGHGGVDPGATGPDGTHEKTVTLAIARALAARIDAAPGMHAVLTRDGDYFVPLGDRRERARAAHADLFVSIHADSVGDRAIMGSSVYILSERGASSEAARRLADHENAADLLGGVSLAAQAPALRPLLMDLSQNAIMGQSGEAAQDVLGALDQVGAVRKREVQQAAFMVLKSPDVPSMLIETAYISNPTEERQLRDPDQQQRLAQAIFSGIAEYFRQYPPQGSLFARAAAERARGEARGAS